MSISQIRRTNKLSRRLSLLSEAITRVGASRPVFFPYKSTLSHPAFSELKEHPPIRYCNRRKARLLHLVEGGTSSNPDVPQIIEIIDHALSVNASLMSFPREPVEYVKRVELAKDYYLSENVRRILLISNGQLEKFRWYFPHDEILRKCQIVPLSWHDNTTIGRGTLHPRELTVLCIASNFVTKGVAIILKAWESVVQRCPEAKLILVSHDIPHSTEQDLSHSVEVVKEIPLKPDTKRALYARASVVIAFTLTDGVTAIEATSYGKPIVVSRTQHSKDFVDNQNGVEIPLPLNVYDVEHYGATWRTKRQYEEAVAHYLALGKFDSSIEALADALVEYQRNPTLLERHRQNAVEKYYRDHVVTRRNHDLVRLYEELL